ncbi:MAG: hypothetical protein J6A69_12020 [Clostridia bacterium]|nr:hypothetical protein [Clostridia bacterium]
MKKILSDKNKICSIVCIVLLVAVMAAQFLPYWHGEFVEESIQNGQKVTVTDTALSVAEYVWFPKDHVNFGRWLGMEAATADPSASADIDLNAFVLVPALQLLIGLIGIVALSIKMGKYQSSFFAGANGVIGLIGFITSPYLKLGSLWGLFIALDALLVVACVATFAIGIIEKRKNRIV